MKKKLKSKRDEKPVRIFLIQFPVLRLGGGVALGIASLLWQMVLWFVLNTIGVGLYANTRVTNARKNMSGSNVDVATTSIVMNMLKIICGLESLCQSLITKETTTQTVVWIRLWVGGRLKTVWLKSATVTATRLKAPKVAVATVKAPKVIARPRFSCARLILFDQRKLVYIRLGCQESIEETSMLLMSD